MTTMTLDQICNLPVKNITKDDCILFMWVTDSHLDEGIKLMKWGYKTIALG